MFCSWELTCSHNRFTFCISRRTAELTFGWLTAGYVNEKQTEILPEGTSQATINLTTDENAVCRYSTTANTEYTSMINTFSATGGLEHATSLTGLVPGATKDIVFSVDVEDNVDYGVYTIPVNITLNGVIKTLSTLLLSISIISNL